MGIVITIIILNVIMMIRLVKNERKFNNIDINSHDSGSNNVNKKSSVIKTIKTTRMMIKMIMDMWKLFSKLKQSPRIMFEYEKEYKDKSKKFENDLYL